MAEGSKPCADMPTSVRDCPQTREKAFYQPVMISCWAVVLCEPWEPSPTSLMAAGLGWGGPRGSKPSSPGTHLGSPFCLGLRRTSWSRLPERLAHLPQRVQRVTPRPDHQILFQNCCFIASAMLSFLSLLQLPAVQSYRAAEAEPGLSILSFSLSLQSLWLFSHR